MDELQTPQVETTSPATPRYGIEQTGLRRYFSNHRQLLTYGVGGLLVIILGVLAYNYYISEQQDEAVVKMFRAQRYFDEDSLTPALKGMGKDAGFMAIEDDYAGTKAANLAHYYNGMIMLRQGKYQEAIDHLKSFSSTSKIMMPLALGAIGDAYVQLKDYEQAATYYTKAARHNANKFTTPRYLKKAGLVYEELKKYGEAINAYQEIRDNYPMAADAGQIDKYLGRAHASLELK